MSSTPTLTELGARVPISRTSHVLTCTLVAAPNGTDFSVQVAEEVSGVLTLDTEILAATQLLSPRDSLNNGGQPRRSHLIVLE